MHGVQTVQGAGQQVSQVTFAGQDWRTGPRERARQMFDVFPVVRQLHELLWYLNEALTLAPARPIHADLAEPSPRRSDDEPIPGGTRGVGWRERAPTAGQHAPAANQRTRARGSRPRQEEGAARRRPHGHHLEGADLRGANLRGAYLIAADLTGADLRGADLIGADLRDTDLTDADLTDAFFLTQPQLNAARGSAGTRLPRSVAPPGHWTQ